MKHRMTRLAPCMPLLLAASIALCADVVTFPPDAAICDIRQGPWEHLATDAHWASRAGFGRSEADMRRDAELAKTEIGPVAQESGWKPIQIGRRWEKMGHPELNDRVTWLRLRFRVSDEIKGYRLGFFCTAVDDAADFYLNGTHLGRKMYYWGARVPEPVDIDLTPSLKLGEENVLMVRVNDSAQARGGGVLGSVLLYRTLPYSRTASGGIQLAAGAPEAVSVLLHLGDAVLSRGGRTAFRPDELAAMKVPPYILRDDELVLVMPSSTAARKAGPHRVELDEVNPTDDDRPLAVACADLPDRAGRFDAMVLPIEVAGSYGNAFDPRQINVNAVVETPGGKTEKITGFFWQDFTSVAIGETEEILLPKRCAPWRIYYRPREIGVHKIHVLAQDKTGVRRTPDQSFEVVPSDRKGFLRVSREDPRFFEFDNGESYFGIGPSGWSRDENYIFGGNPRCVSTRRLDDYYRRKAEGGSNYDYCLAEFFGRLYTRGGYIDQHVAWKCEHRLRTLESLGIYWVTCYDDLCRSVIYGLDTLPYSTAQGGPCGSIEELYVNERALEMQRDHLRYFVARMSDSPALLVWAIGDEGQAGSRFSPLMVRSWIKGLQNYVRSIDVYEHPHVMCEGPRSIAEGGDAIIIPDWYFKRDVDAVTLNLELMEKYGQFQCPLINPEGGMVEWTKPEDDYGPKRALYYLTGERWKFPEAISFHNHLWSSLFLKNAVGGTEWLGAFIVGRGEMCHAAAVRNFLAGESLTKPHWEMATAPVSNEALRCLCLVSEGRSLAWIHNRSYSWIEAGHRGKAPPSIEGADVAVPVKKQGGYRVELWDTRAGKMISTTAATSSDLAVKYALPPVQKDVALKLVRHE